MIASVFCQNGYHSAATRPAKFVWKREQLTLQSSCLRNQLGSHLELTGLWAVYNCPSSYHTLLLCLHSVRNLSDAGAQEMEAHTREGILQGLAPEATAAILQAMPRAMALSSLQALIKPIAQQVSCVQPGASVFCGCKKLHTRSRFVYHYERSPGFSI